MKCNASTSDMRRDPGPGSISLPCICNAPPGRSWSLGRPSLSSNALLAALASLSCGAMPLFKFYTKSEFWHLDQSPDWSYSDPMTKTSLNMTDHLADSKTNLRIKILPILWKYIWPNKKSSSCFHTKQKHQNNWLTICLSKYLSLTFEFQEATISFPGVSQFMEADSHTSQCGFQQFTHQWALAWCPFWSTYKTKFLVLVMWKSRWLEIAHNWVNFTSSDPVSVQGLHVLGLLHCPVCILKCKFDYIHFRFLNFSSF